MNSFSRENQASLKEAGIDRWAAFGVFCALLFLYGRTLCPTVGVGDSGELITAAYTLGIPHPTGYPLYVLLGKLFLFLFPFGEEAFRMNFFSAVTAAAGGTVFYRWMRALGNPYWIAFSSALTLGCSLSFWSQATVARVYSLNALLICLCLYYGSLPVQTFRTKAWFFFWWGLALANHPLSIIVGILFVALWLLKRDFPLCWKKTVWFVLPGLSLYLLIPLRSLMNPPLDIGNPETLSALWAYFTRAGYWKNQYVDTFSDVPVVIKHYLATVPEEFTWLGVALILVGIYYLIVKKEKDLLFLTGGLFFMNIFLVASHGSIRDIFQWSRYMIPGYIGLSLIIGYGLRFCSEQNSDHLHVSLNRLLKTGLPILLPLLLLWSNFPQNNRSGDYLAYDYNYKILTMLPMNAAIFPMEDNTAYPMMYLQKVLGVRPDVKLHISYYDQGKWIRFDRSRELYFTDLYLDIPPDTVLRPDGLSFRLMNPEDPPPVIKNWGSWQLKGASKTNLSSRDFLTRTLVSQYWYFMALAVKPINNRNAEKLLSYSLDISNDDDRAWARIAFYYHLQGDQKRTEEYLLGALRINPKNKTAAIMLKSIRALQPE